MKYGSNNNKLLIKLYSFNLVLKVYLMKRYIVVDNNLLLQLSNYVFVLSLQSNIYRCNVFVTVIALIVFLQLDYLPKSVISILLVSLFEQHFWGPLSSSSSSSMINLDSSSLCPQIWTQ